MCNWNSKLTKKSSIFYTLIYSTFREREITIEISYTPAVRLQVLNYAKAKGNTSRTFYVGETCI